jgi:hypothetical protein
LYDLTNISKKYEPIVMVPKETEIPISAGRVISFAGVLTCGIEALSEEKIVLKHYTNYLSPTSDIPESNKYEGPMTGGSILIGKTQKNKEDPPI